MASDTPLSRSIDHGSIILNAVFVRRMPKQRIWKTAMRFSILDMVIIGISVLLFTVLGIGFAQVLSAMPGVGSDKGIPLSIIFGMVAAVVGFLFGRAATKFSPYRKTSGESLGEWFRVQKEQRYRWTDRLIGRRHFSEMKTTWVDGVPTPVECKVYIGSAPVPRSPIPRGFVGDIVELILVPRNVPTNWVYRERARLATYQMQDELRREKEVNEEVAG